MQRMAASPSVERWVRVAGFLRFGWTLAQTYSSVRTPPLERMAMMRRADDDGRAKKRRYSKRVF